MKSLICCGSSKKKETPTKTSPGIKNDAERLQKNQELVKSVKVSKVPLESARATMNVKGMDNIGNSCYLNAAVQCLSNTSEFTEFMLTGKWQADANAANPIGTDGKLLAEYVRLIHKLWGEDDRKSINPEKFKSVLDKICSTVSLI